MSLISAIEAASLLDRAKLAISSDLSNSLSPRTKTNIIKALFRISFVIYCIGTIHHVISLNPYFLDAAMFIFSAIFPVYLLGTGIINFSDWSHHYEHFEQHVKALLNQYSALSVSTQTVRQIEAVGALFSILKATFPNEIRLKNPEMLSDYEKGLHLLLLNHRNQFYFTHSCFEAFENNQVALKN